jgi:DNA-binding IclR family transcriptional regulator
MPLSPSPAVVRAADLLTHLAARPDERLSVSALARHLDIPRATCDTLLLGLAERGFVTRDASRRYGLGPSCLLLGDAARVANPAIQTARAHAERLARDLSAVSAVSISDGSETRVVAVFDYGPPVGLRVRAGEAIRLVPPFGASFVAWGAREVVERWLDRAEPPLSAAERTSYADALAHVRERGFSVTQMTDRQPKLISALEGMFDDRSPEDARRARDEAIQQMTHSEYLPADLPSTRPLRVAQVSAPVFDSDGAPVASIMLLGPNHDVTTGEVGELGRRVSRAAMTATAEAAGFTPDHA